MIPQNTAKIPNLIYGTAWKENSTEDIVSTALKLGFRAIDTANQRCHYNEAGVGDAISKSGIQREELFIQTKYTYANGQDNRIPYNPHANYSTQLQQSFQSSLEHLHTDYLNSYILHGPSTSFGLTQVDLEVWQAMEALHKEEKIKYLGVSNVNLEQLKILFEEAKIKPTFVQNRCFAHTKWDEAIRDFCKQNNIIYQAFSILTANTFIIPHIKKIADIHNKTSAQVLFRFSQQIGILPLTGTTSEAHMKEDLHLDFNLTDEQIRFIESIEAISKP